MGSADRVGEVYIAVGGKSAWREVYVCQRARRRKVPANGATEVCPRDRMNTRSATKAQRVEEEEEAAEPLPLDKLAPEILNIIAEALADDEDVLIPRHLGSLARSCKVIKEAVKDAKDKLKVKYDAARALLVKCGNTVELLVQLTIVGRWPAELCWIDSCLLYTSPSPRDGLLSRMPSSA